MTLMIYLKKTATKEKYISAIGAFRKEVFVFAECERVGNVNRVFVLFA